MLFNLSERAVPKRIRRFIAPMPQGRRYQGYHGRIPQRDLRRSPVRRQDEMVGPEARLLLADHFKELIEYAKGCIKCQIYGPIKRVPADALHPVTKPWPFRGWVVDIIGKIHPAASNQHAWVLVATDYFTKWVEAESYRFISSTQVVRFFENHIVHRFGIPETITSNNGPVFASAETREYVKASNKVIKGILKKMIEEKPRAWHDLLPEALLA
ncbi:unnamed protein product [Prunus armeniaca]